jgi:hypothetical protein
MSMTAVIADYDVPFIHPGQNANSIGFLADICMRRTENKAAWEGIEHSLLEKADAEHLPIQAYVIWGGRHEYPVREIKG